MYHSPVVQNLGLFLQGIEEPLPALTHLPALGSSTPTADDNNYDVGHKRDLLSKVRKLYIINTSSAKPGGAVYMVTRGSHLYDGNTADCHADKLGSVDLAAWELASDLLSPRDHPVLRHLSLSRLFTCLETICFGTWDDGRWNTYYQRLPDDSRLHHSETTRSEDGLGTPDDIVAQRSMHNARRMIASGLVKKYVS